MFLIEQVERRTGLIGQFAGLWPKQTVLELWMVDGEGVCGSNIDTQTHTFRQKKIGTRWEQVKCLCGEGGGGKETEEERKPSNEEINERKQKKKRKKG